MGWINLDQEIPWALSDIAPSELKTLDDLTDNLMIQEQRRVEALMWAELGLATSKTDRCNHCGEYYSRPNPNCSGASVHDDYESEEPSCVPCSYPGCNRLTSRDPIYDDLCYEHIRADNE